MNCLFVIGFNDSRYGGDGPADGNPFINANINGEIDVDILNQWYGWFQTLDAAGIVVAFNIYDDLIDVLPGKRMNWDLIGGNLHPQEQKYIDAVVNKFKTLKNLIWVVNESANKTYPSTYVQRWKKIAARIRSIDTFLHPISIGIVVETDPNVTPNTGMSLYLDDPNFDQIIVQHVQPTSVVDMYNKMLAQWNAAAGKINLMLGQAWPVNNGADGRKKNWATAMAGAYVIQAYAQAGSGVGHIGVTGRRSECPGIHRQFLPRDSITQQYGSAQRPQVWQYQVRSGGAWPDLRSVLRPRVGKRRRARAYQWHLQSDVAGYR